MKEKIVTYTKDELKKMKGKTNFKKLRETTDKDIENLVKNDSDTVIPSIKELDEFKPINNEAD